MLGGFRQPLPRPGDGQSEKANRGTSLQVKNYIIHCICVDDIFDARSDVILYKYRDHPQSLIFSRMRIDDDGNIEIKRTGKTEVVNQ